MRLPSAAQQYIHRVLNQRGWQYQAVNEDEKTYEQADSIRWRRLPGRSLLMAAALLVLIVSGLIFAPWSRQTNWQPNRHQHHMMHGVLIPSAVPDSELCKTVLSSFVLGYPVPEMVNYNETLDAAGREVDRERSKVKILSDYFSRISTKSDDNVAVVLDTSYAWVQLRPEVLLQRYYDLNHKSNMELRKTYSIEDVTTRGVRQTVIVSTGGIISDDTNRIGTVMGTVRSLRALYREANAQAIETLGDASSHTLLTKIYQRQEIQRKVLQQQNWSWITRTWGSLMGSLKSAPGSLDRPGDEDDFEFGIGLDTDSNIGMPIDQNSEYQWTDSTVNHGYGYSSIPLPKELTSSTPPFWTPSGKHERAGARWGDVNLLHNSASGSVPVFITFPWGPTNFQRTEWTRFWMQSSAKMLLEESFAIPKLPVASVVEPNGIEHTFWDSSVRFDRALVRTVEGAVAKWDDICNRDEIWAASRI